MNIKGLESFIDDLERMTADKPFKREVATWLDASGFQFLEEIQREIIRTDTVLHRRLLNSFDKGNSDNVWSISNGGLSIEIGTNVEYASLVNDGHKLVDKKYSFKLKDGRKARWVPGVFGPKGFEYVKGSDDGMLIIEKWIEGTHYFDNALKIFEKMFDVALAKKLEKWLERGGRR